MVEVRIADSTPKGVLTNALGAIRMLKLLPGARPSNAANDQEVAVIR